nr:(2Fe-2S)-binding protein [Mobilitalea sibirica]
MKIPIWYKKDADPKYICYCNQVTEKQIINAVLNDGAKNIKDIIRFTGAMKNGKCEIKNPLGKCCSPFIQETINKVLNNK